MKNFVAALAFVFFASFAGAMVDRAIVGSHGCKCCQPVCTCEYGKKDADCKCYPCKCNTQGLSIADAWKQAQAGKKVTLSIEGFKNADCVVVYLSDGIETELGAFCMVQPGSTRINVTRALKNLEGVTDRATIVVRGHDDKSISGLSLWLRAE